MINNEKSWNFCGNRKNVWLCGFNDLIFFLLLYFALIKKIYSFIFRIQSKLNIVKCIKCNVHNKITTSIWFFLLANDIKNHRHYTYLYMYIHVIIICWKYVVILMYIYDFFPYTTYKIYVLNFSAWMKEYTMRYMNKVFLINWDQLYGGLQGPIPGSLINCQGQVHFQYSRPGYRNTG